MHEATKESSFSGSARLHEDVNLTSVKTFREKFSLIWENVTLCKDLQTRTLSRQCGIVIWTPILEI